MVIQDFGVSITTPMTPAEVFGSISHVSEWWISNVEGCAEAVNQVFTVSLGTTWKKFKVIEMVPNKRIVWQVIDCYLPWNGDTAEWKDTILAWNITVTKEGTRIKFTHIGLLPELECFDQCKRSWTAYIQESLFKYITQGKGQPNKF